MVFGGFWEDLPGIFQGEYEALILATRAFKGNIGGYFEITTPLRGSRGGRSPEKYYRKGEVLEAISMVFEGF